MHIIGNLDDVAYVNKHIDYFDNRKLFNISHSEGEGHESWMHVKIKPGFNRYDGGYTPYDSVLRFLNGYVLEKQLYDTGRSFFYNYRDHKGIASKLASRLTGFAGLTRAEAGIILNIGTSADDLKHVYRFDNYFETLAMARAKVMRLKASLIVI